MTRSHVPETTDVQTDLEPLHHSGSSSEVNRVQ